MTLASGSEIFAAEDLLHREILIELGLSQAFSLEKLHYQYLICQDKFSN